MSDTLSVSLPEPLAAKVRAAAEACGLSPNEWAEIVLRQNMDAERRERTARIEAASHDDA